MWKFYLIYVRMANEHKESEDRNISKSYFDSNSIIHTTERNSSSASFKSCIRRRSRALIDKRNVRCFRSPVPLLPDDDCCCCCCSPVFDDGAITLGKGKFQRGEVIELFAIQRQPI